MFNRKSVAVAVVLCVLTASSVIAQSREEPRRDPISRIVKIINHYLPWLGHLPTDDGLIIPKP